MNPAKVRNFWDWFSQRAPTLRDDLGGHDEEIQDMVSRLHEALAWEMGTRDGQAFDFVVRTEDAEIRHIAREIVAAAPKISGWTFSDWRLPHPADEIRFSWGEGVEFDAADFTAELAPDEQYPVLHLTLASDKFGKLAENERAGAGFLLLDWILGERTVEETIESVSFRTGPAGAVVMRDLPGEIERRVAELRARPAGASENWMILEGEADGLPIVASVMQDLDRSRMAGHPWLVEARVGVHEPTEAGLLHPGESETLNRLEERLTSFLEARTSALFWGHTTHESVRTVCYYVGDSAGLVEALPPVAAESGYECAVAVIYDPRWRAYRRYTQAKQ